MDTYVLRLGNELITSAWDYPSIAGDPVRGRCNHAACVVRRSDTWQMFVFGGRVFSETRSGRFELTNTLLCLQPREPSFAALDLEWKQMQCSGPLPPARELSTLQAVGNKVLMCGGWLGLQQAPWIRDFWILDTERMGWVSLVFEDRWPSARFAHSAAMVDYRVRLTLVHSIFLPFVFLHLCSKPKRSAPCVSFSFFIGSPRVSVGGLSFSTLILRSDKRSPYA